MNEHMHSRKIIPIKVVGAMSDADPALGPDLDACASAEPFALMVLGDSMEPEFAEGEIIVIEPEGLVTDGSFVMAELNGELIFRQLAIEGDSWQLRPLNPAYPAAAISGPGDIRGVIIQKSKPGRRKASKRYVE